MDLHHVSPGSNAESRTSSTRTVRFLQSASDLKQVYGISIRDYSRIKINNLNIINIYISLFELEKLIINFVVIKLYNLKNCLIHT